MGLGLSLPLWLQGHCLLASCEVPQPRFLLERGSPSPGAACMTPAGGPGRARTAVFACRVLREPEAGSRSGSCLVLVSTRRAGGPSVVCAAERVAEVSRVGLEPACQWL